MLACRPAPLLQAEAAAISAEQAAQVRTAALRAAAGGGTLPMTGARVGCRSRCVSASWAHPAAARHRHRLPQANEQRYRLLEGKHTSLVAEKEKLFQENEALRQVRLQSVCCSSNCLAWLRPESVRWPSRAACLPALHREPAAQELTAARMEHSKAQTALMSKDAELERRAVEVAALQSDKAGLDKLLQVAG